MLFGWWPSDSEWGTGFIERDSYGRIPLPPLPPDRQILSWHKSVTGSVQCGCQERVPAAESWRSQRPESPWRGGDGGGGGGGGGRKWTEMRGQLESATGEHGINLIWLTLLCCCQAALSNSTGGCNLTIITQQAQPHSPNAGLMLAQRRRRCTNLMPALGESLVSADNPANPV